MHESVFRVQPHNIRYGITPRTFIGKNIAEIHEDFDVCVTRSANHTGFHADKRAMCRVFVDSLPQEGKEYIKGLVTPKKDMPSFKNSPQSISAEDQLQLKDVWKIPIRAWTALSQSFVAVKSWYYLERVQVARNKEIEEALDVRNRVWVDDAKGGSQQVRGIDVSLMKTLNATLKSVAALLSKLTSKIIMDGALTGGRGQVNLCFVPIGIDAYSEQSPHSTLSGKHVLG